MWSDKTKKKKLLKEIIINNSGDFPNVVYYIWKAAEEIRRFKSFFINLYE